MRPQNLKLTRWLLGKSKGKFCVGVCLRWSCFTFETVILSLRSFFGNFWNMWVRFNHVVSQWKTTDFWCGGIELFYWNLIQKNFIVFVEESSRNQNELIVLYWISDEILSSHMFSSVKTIKLKTLSCNFSKISIMTQDGKFHILKASLAEKVWDSVVSGNLFMLRMDF